MKKVIVFAAALLFPVNVIVAGEMGIGEEADNEGQNSTSLYEQVVDWLTGQDD